MLPIFAELCRYQGLNSSANIGSNTIEVDNARIIDTGGDEYTITKLTIGLVVNEQYFEGPWVIEEAQGLYNALNDTFHAYGNMKSATLSVKEMEQTFIELELDKVKQDRYSIILDVTSEYH